MEMCYNGSLVMPCNYAVINDNEMEYVQGGWSATVNGTVSSIRNRLSAIITACIAGDASSIAVGALGGIAGIVFAGISGGWFTNILSKASEAHSKAEGWIKKYGRNKKCKMTSTWAILWCTGISLSI